MVQVGVVSEQCFPYSAHDSYCRSHCKPRWTKGKVGVNNGMPVRVRDPWVKTHAEAGSAQYLKGERQMQLAILEGGPIVASMGIPEIGPDRFMAYKSGVYKYIYPPRCGHHSHVMCCAKYRDCHRFHKYKWNAKTKKMDKSIHEQEIKHSGHAVTIVGWGEVQDEELVEDPFSRKKSANKKKKIYNYGAPKERGGAWLPKIVGTKDRYGRTITKAKKYWVVENSWGNGWGEGGFFRIERGTDMLGIEYRLGISLKPGHRVKYKHNSRCQCNAHGAVAESKVHSTGPRTQRPIMVNQCKCDHAWGGDKVGVRMGYHC